MESISDEIDAVIVALQNNGFEVEENDEGSGILVFADSAEPVQEIVDTVCGGSGPHVQASDVVIESDGLPRVVDFEAYWI